MNNDPFSFDDDDRTVLQPGGRNHSTPGSGHFQSDNNSHGMSGQNVPLDSVPLYGGINKLELAASRLLPLLVTLKNSSSHPSPDQLRNKLIRELDQFKNEARHVLNDPKKVTQASYVMCTVLDEAVMNTPWGHQANWSQHNLLSTFHNEVAGGQRFFGLLKALGKEPSKNIDLLELMYVCLSLGYEGSYRIASNGQETLIKARNWVYEIICSVREQPDPALSESWHGSNIKERRLPRLTPLWVLSAAAFGLASFTFVFFRVSLSNLSNDTISTFWDTKAEALIVSTVLPPIKPLVKTTEINRLAKSLTNLLSTDIDSGSLEVNETFSEGTIRIKGDNLFSSGQADINDTYYVLIEHVANALNMFDGRILVTGHSDNIPVSTGRYPSNLELSQARAQSVLALLSLNMTDNNRLEGVGRGSFEPIADNKTQQGRDINRRVEIRLYF